MSETAPVITAAEPTSFKRLLLQQRNGDRGIRERVAYRQALESKLGTKKLVPELVSGLRAPITFGTFPSIDAVEMPDAGAFVLKPTRAAQSRGVFCLRRLGGDRVQDMTTGEEADFAAIRASYTKQHGLGAMSASCLTEEYIAPLPGYARPHDFKMYCFRGDIPVIMQKAYITHDRTKWRFKFWSPDWQDLGPIKYPNRLDPQMQKPAMGERAVELARALSMLIALPFSRIDIYCTETEVIFSEITPYPNNGKDFFNREWDEKLGHIWLKHADPADYPSRDVLTLPEKRLKPRKKPLG